MTQQQLSNETLWLFSELTSQMTAATSVEGLRIVLARQLRWLIDYERCTIALRAKPEADRLQLLEIAINATAVGEIPLADNWPGRVIMENKPYFIDNIDRLPPSIQLPDDNATALIENAQSLILLPLIFEEQVIGSLNFSFANPGNYSAANRSLVSLLAMHLGGKLGSLLAHTTAIGLTEQLVYEAYRADLGTLAYTNSNRDRIEKRVQQLLEQEQATTALLMIELSRYDFISAALGSEIAAALTEQVIQCLQNEVYQLSFIAQIDSAKLALVLTNIKDVAVVEQLMSRLLAVLQKPFNIAEHELFLTPFAGISLAPTDGSLAKDLLRKADCALQFCREQTKTSFLFYSREMDAAAQNLAIESQLRWALERNELQLRFQPLVELNSSKIIGAEALLRWKHPQLGLISPAKFIPLAEKTGLIVPIGSWVLQEACQQARQWQQSGLPNFKISVNLSALQFDNNFVGMVVRALQSGNLPSQSLELELTESTLLSDYNQIYSKLSLVKAMGVNVAIDDFGTGYSSLAHLQKLPVNTIKIDQSFVRALKNKSLTGAAKDSAIIETIVAMAKKLNLKTVAEGVEIEQQRRFLQSIGCDVMQGFLVSAPLDVAEFENLLARSTRKWDSWQISSSVKNF